MTASTLKSDLGHTRGAESSRLVFCVCFAMFLVIAVIAQLLFIPWRSWMTGAEDHRSLIGGVRSAVYTLLSNIP